MNFSVKHTFEFIVDGLHTLSWARMGWSFLLAWVFCVFYTAALGGTSIDSMGGTSVASLVLSVLPVSASVITLVVVVLLERRMGSPIAYKWALYLAPLTAGFATPLLFFGSLDTPVLVAVYVIGGIATGFGSGLLWVMWGEFYARITQEDVEYLAPASALLAAVLAIVVSSMQGWVPLVVVSAMPLASGACLFGAWRQVNDAGASGLVRNAVEKTAVQSTDAEKTDVRRVMGAMGRSCFGILVACLLICVEGGLFDDSTQTANVQIALVVGLLFMIIVGISAISGPRRVSLAFLYRWICPALVIGLTCVILLGPEAGLLVAYAVAIAARFAFCLITQMYFARYASASLATPVQAYGLGWISVHLGDALGVVALMFARWGISSSAFSLDQVVAFSAAALVVCTMFVLSDERSYNRTLAGHVAAAPAQASVSVDNSESLQPVGPSEAENETQAQVDEDAALDARVAELARQAKLTPRELEVFGLLARGRSVPYIRDALVISRETAATHTKHIYAKLDVHSRQELIDLVH